MTQPRVDQVREGIAKAGDANKAVAGSALETATAAVEQRDRLAELPAPIGGSSAHA